MEATEDAPDDVKPTLSELVNHLVQPEITNHENGNEHVNENEIEIENDVVVEHQQDDETITTTMDEDETQNSMIQDTNESSNYNHQCYICDKIFSANSNLNRHLRKIHQENVQSPYNNVKCALCDSVYSSSIIYNNHLEKDHKVYIETEQLTFPDRESFEDWKHSIENETTSQFIKSRGEKKTKNVNKTYYSCNRSGYYVSKARTRKALKKQGSRKINGRCPASMNVTINPDLSYGVRFVKTHVGHEHELQHLDLSEKDRELIVQKLVAGVTKKEIIKQLRLAAEQQVQQQEEEANRVNNKPLTPTSSVTVASITSAIAHAGGDRQSVIVSTSENCVEIIPTTSVGLDSTSNARLGTSSVISPPKTTTARDSSASPSKKTKTSSKTTTTTTTAATTPTIITTTSNNSIINSSQQQKASRLYLATTKDIHNIINSKHLDSKLIRHNYDLNNVEAWISEMKEFNEASSVLFYKSQSELIDRFPCLREEDFMLIIMKDGQSDILKTHGEKCIIIDSTHNVHCEYLHLATVSVIDQDEKDFPVAFLFSTRTDCDILEVFFTIMKDKVGKVNTRMVIADELNDFYSSWTKVMSQPIYNLLTPWSVFDNWAKKFDLISNKEKLRKIKKSLRGLLMETDSDKFNRSLKQMVEENKQDKEVVDFLKYFNTKFARSPDLWSSCLRKSHGASNSVLWKMHDRFKAVYKDGKSSKKMCKYVASLMTLFDEAQLKHLSILEDQNPAKEKALSHRHRKSAEIGSLVYEVAVEPAYWLCPSESSSEAFYEVKREINQKPNCCDLKCTICNTCRHEYKCTCLDYIVNLNMCKHIHRICTMCK